MKRFALALCAVLVVALAAAAYVAASDLPAWPADPARGLPSAGGEHTVTKTSRNDVGRVAIEWGDWLRATFPGISVIGKYEDEAGAYIHVGFQTQEQLDAALASPLMPALLDGARVVVDSIPMPVEPL